MRRLITGAISVIRSRRSGNDIRSPQTSPTREHHIRHDVVVMSFSLPGVSCLVVP